MQVLRVEPEHELKFKGPFNASSKAVLKLWNPSEKRVCFKIKTTAPSRYHVRPNMGILHPSQSVVATVVFLPRGEEQEPTTATTKHKFLVQALFAPDGDEFINWGPLWKDGDADSTKMMATKLQCTFELPVKKSELAKE